MSASVWILVLSHKCCMSVTWFGGCAVKIKAFLCLIYTFNICFWCTQVERRHSFNFPPFSSLLWLWYTNWSISVIIKYFSITLNLTPGQQCWHVGSSTWLATIPTWLTCYPVGITHESHLIFMGIKKCKQSQLAWVESSCCSICATENLIFLQKTYWNSFQILVQKKQQLREFLKQY